MSSFKTLAFLSAVASAAYAQSLIPTSDISSGCSSFLSEMNSNSTLTSCTAPLISATSAFGPSGSGSSASSSAVTSALGSLCSASSGACSDALVRGKLTDFYAACTPELTSSPNADVVRMYDVLYSLVPLKNAVCAKDDSGAYCVSQLSSQASGSSSAAAASPSASAGIVGMLANGLSVSNVQKFLWSGEEGAFVPNTTTIGASNIAFLFLSASTPNAQLCTTCTRDVMTAYMDFESSIQYAPGIGQSPMLSGQTSLISAISTKCGSSFLSGAVAAAGSLSDGIASSAQTTAVASRFAMGGALLGAIVFGAVAAF